MKLLISAALAFAALTAYGQQLTLKGDVKDASGLPLPGASVYVVGAQGKGAATDGQGVFTLSGLTPGATVRVSYTGFKTQDFEFRGQPHVNIVLEEDLGMMDEVVIIGYGTQVKKDLTGALSTVGQKELATQPAMTATQSLQGKVAGLQVVSSGAPGSSPLVRIRGTGTLLGGADPLYVVDGVLTTDIRNLNNSDIKSVEVLKDASSAAIYGVRAANGVILITTYRGAQGRARVSYNNYIGFNTVQKKVKMAGTALFAAYTNEALDYEGQPPLFDMNDLPPYDTQWIDAITRRGQLQEQNVSISGGTENATYYGSASYYNNGGILKSNAYERLTVRLANDYTISKMFEAGLNIGLSTFRSNNAPFSAFTAAYRAAPVLPPQYDDGSYSYFSDGNVANPLALIDYTHDKSRGTRIQGNAYIVVKPVKGLSFRSQMSVDWSANNGQIYVPEYFVSSQQKNDVSKLTLSRDKYTTWIWDNIITYDYSKGRSKLTVTLGMTAEEQTSTFLSASRQNVPPDENYWTLDLGDIATSENASNKTKMHRASYLGRVFYGWDSKYLITVTGRFDGSSRFPSNNRWAFFPSAGLAWRLSGEKFLSDSRAVSNLKLRASWGQLGNDAVTDDAFVYTITSGLSYVLGQDQFVVPGGTVTDVKDPDLKWEKTTEWDFGLDYGFFADRLYGSFDYYIKKTKDALIMAPVDAVFGDPDGAYLTNKADIKNTGFEFIVTWSDNVAKNWKYDISLNATYNKNSITNVRDGIPIVSGFLGNGQLTTRTQIGKPVGAFWVYQTDGIFRTQQELDDWIAAGKPVLEGTKVGDLKYVDRSGNGTLGDEDKYCPGAYSAPWMFGLNAGIEYKGFDFRVDISAVTGNKIYNGNMALRLGNENIQSSLSGRWTKDRTDTDIPRASNTVPVSSDFYIQSGRYLKLNTVTIGYSLPEKALEKMKLSRMRFYVSALNPLVFKKYSGYSAELPSGTLNSGVDLNSYPQTSSYIFGMNVNFN